jgi:hypothetical protein
MLRYHNRQKEAKATVKNIFKSKDNIFIIHYSCESFYDIENGRTPRITSIAIKYLNSENDVSFSIHKIAEIEGNTDIPGNYDYLEKKMLDEFYSFLRLHENYKWLHWNMKNINYGFEAIAHRYRVLGGEPIHIDNEKKINLAKLLYDIYGTNYIEKPRLYKIIKLNNLKEKDLLDGKEEAEAFKNNDFVKLHRSTLKKVDAMYNLLDLAYLNKLKTKASFLDKNGGILMVIPNLIKENPFISTFITISGWILAIIEFFH